MYYSWDMKRNRQNFLSFWAIFSPFTPLTAKKIKSLKKCKKHLEISSFYTNVPKIMIIYYSIPEIWHITDVIIFFARLPPWQPKKSKFKRNEKKNWRYHHFTYVYQKLWSGDVRCLIYGVWQTDRQKMDGCTDGKSDIQRSMPQLKMQLNIFFYKEKKRRNRIS